MEGPFPLSYIEFPGCVEINSKQKTLVELLKKQSSRRSHLQLAILMMNLGWCWHLGGARLLPRLRKKDDICKCPRVYFRICQMHGPTSSASAPLFHIERQPARPRKRLLLPEFIARRMGIPNKIFKLPEH